MPTTLGSIPAPLMFLPISADEQDVEVVEGNPRKQRESLLEQLRYRSRSNAPGRTSVTEWVFSAAFSRTAIPNRTETRSRITRAAGMIESARPNLCMFRAPWCLPQPTVSILQMPGLHLTPEGRVRLDPVDQDQVVRLQDIPCDEYFGTGGEMTRGRRPPWRSGSAHRQDASVMPRCSRAPVSAPRRWPRRGSPWRER